MPRLEKDKLQKKIDNAQEELEEAEELLGLRARKQLLGFIDFIRSQGVVGLATGIILGTAVTNVVRSLVDDIINPLIGTVLPSEDLSQESARIMGVTIGWGSFTSNLIDFLLIAFVVYVGFKLLKLEKLDKKKN